MLMEHELMPMVLRLQVNDHAGVATIKLWGDLATSAIVEAAKERETRWQVEGVCYQMKACTCTSQAPLSAFSLCFCYCMGALSLFLASESKW